MSEQQPSNKKIKKIVAPVLLAASVAAGAAAYKAVTGEASLPDCKPGQSPTAVIGGDTPTINDLAEKLSGEDSDFRKLREAIVEVNDISDVGKVAAGTVVQVCEVPSPRNN